MQPPRQIDGATVLEWAWSDVPFGYVGGAAGVAVHGLAICQYEGSSKVVRLPVEPAGAWFSVRRWSVPR